MNPDALELLRHLVRLGYNLAAPSRGYGHVLAVSRSHDGVPPLPEDLRETCQRHREDLLALCLQGVADNLSRARDDARIALKCNPPQRVLP